MTIALNGDPHETQARSIAELIDELRLPAPTMLVEHNAIALRRDEWATCRLAEGDRVELMRIAAGG